MKKIKRKWDLLSEDKRKFCVNEIITFFAQERDETIGVIAAGEILDFIMQIAGGEFYNKGVEASKETIKKRFEDMELDLDLLLNK